jgi:hypothetical protein
VATIRQIAYAAVRYTKDGRIAVAHRGDFVELLDPDVERLQSLGALVPVGAELSRPGELLPLQENATVEHIKSYLASGTADEILRQVDGYTSALQDKLLVEERVGQDRPYLVTGLEQRLGTSATVNLTPEPVAVPNDAEAIINEPVDKVLAVAAEQPELIESLYAAEEAKGDAARKTLLDGLTKLLAKE